MNVFVRTSQFLRHALYVAMETMQFLIVITGLIFMAILFGFKGVTMNNLTPMRICPGCKVGLIGFQDNNIAAIKLNTGRYIQISNFVETIFYATLSKEAKNVKKMVLIRRFYLSCFNWPFSSLRLY